jgi:hypothetical protein
MEFGTLAAAPDPFAAVPPDRVPGHQQAPTRFAGPDPFGRLVAGLFDEAQDTLEAPFPAALSRSAGGLVVQPPPALESGIESMAPPPPGRLAIRSESMTFRLQKEHAFTKLPPRRTSIQAAPWVWLGAALALALVAALLVLGTAT